MLAKYKIITNKGEKEFQVKKNRNSYVVVFEGKEYQPLANGTRVKFNGTDRVVDSRATVFEFGGLVVSTFFNNNAAPEFTSGDGFKIKSNKMANNFAMSFPLFVGLLVAVAVIIVVFAILGI